MNMILPDTKMIAITGPTCTGKSALSCDLATLLNGEIVNFDSMQVYRYFDIGTAKPPKSVMDKIPHHLIDVVDPDGEFNAAIFRDMADRAIEVIREKKHLPILAGGTGLYLRALLYGLFEMGGDKSLREKLKAEYRSNPDALFERLRSVDPEYAAKINRNDSVRVTRALEVYEVSGKAMSAWHRQHGFASSRYNVLKIGLTGSRSDLYSGIDARVDMMLNAGWVEEVRSILRRGYSEGVKPFSGIGYREILRFLKGFTKYEDMVKEIKKSTRHYAKRQFTWFSREDDIIWFGYPQDKETILEKVKEYLS